MTDLRYDGIAILPLPNAYLSTSSLKGGTALTPEPSDNRKKDGVVRPESTVESANTRFYAGAPPASAGSSNGGCESTVESAKRRILIKGAGLLAVGAVVGGLALGIKGARAGPNCSFNVTAGNNNPVFCNVTVKGSVLVDACGKNTGGSVPGLIFGPVGQNGCVSVGISSGTPQNLTSGAPPGLCFFAGGQRRVGISQSGCVSIGVPPSSSVSTLNAGAPTLQVQGVRGCSVGIQGQSQQGAGVVGKSGCIIPCIIPGGGIGVFGISSSPPANGQVCVSIGALGATRGIASLCTNESSLGGAGVVGGSVQFAAGGNITRFSPGRGIGVRGISGFAPGVVGTSCVSAGVVGVGGRGSILPCIMPSGCNNITGGSLHVGVVGSSCVSAGVLGVSSGNANVAAVCGRSSLPSSNGQLSAPPGLGIGVRGTSGCSAGVSGISSHGPGLQGRSKSGPALSAQTCSSTIGCFSNSATSGDKSALIRLQAGCTAVTNAGCVTLNAWSAGVSGAGNVCSVPPGSFYIGKQGNPRLILGPTGLQVKGSLTACGGITNNGGLTAKTFGAIASCSVQSYQMKPSCFAVFADAAGLPGHKETFTVTLPAASSSAGMLVFINKIDKSKNSVTVAAGPGDSISGDPSEKLSRQYSAIELVSDGNHTWYEISQY